MSRSEAVQVPLSGGGDEGAASEGWVRARCPLCGGREHERVFPVRGLYFGTSAEVELARCACGLLLTNPQPRGETLAGFYGSEQYYTHASEEGAKARLRAWLQRLQMRGVGARVRLFLERRWGVRRFAKRNLPEYFTLEAGQRALDFGCGNGDYMRVWKDLGMDCVGVEPDGSARGEAQRRGLAVVESLEELDRAGAGGPRKFDRILLRHVLEHLPDPVGVLSKLGERLERSGLMMIAVPNANALQAEVFGQYWLGYDMPRHLWHFTPESLERTVKLAQLWPVHAETVELANYAAISQVKAREVTGGQVAYGVDDINAMEAAGRGTEAVIVVKPVNPVSFVL